MKRFLYYSFMTLLSIGFLGAIVAIAGAVYIISYYGRDLPDHSQLKDYKPPIVTRLYAGDGRLMEEYATEKRVFVPIEAIPPVVKQAFISAEDKKFYSHKGLDYEAIARAMLQNVERVAAGQRPIGASTITQQIAKNFLLTNEVSFKRKIREAIIALRMERVLSKDRLLELYLNEIYLGGGAHGVAAAALRYFNKSLEELEIHEAAYLAALPKAPNNYHPVRNHDDALGRRNWVISRLAEDGYITQAQAEMAAAKPLTMVEGREATVNAPYFAEEVRRELKERYGEKDLYEAGFAVRTSADPRLQEIAVRTLRAGLMEYDMRRGWRGAPGKITDMGNWQAELAAFVPSENMLSAWVVAAVLSVSEQSAEIGLAGGKRGQILFDDTRWAITNPTSMRQILNVGDIVMAEKKMDADDVWLLRQIPAVQGALIAMDPHTGRVLAMQGGWKYESSEFNRATQAWRQPGSAFKPFVYLAALDSGFTPATLVLDAPFVIEQRPGVKWRPVNYSGEYYGPTPIRVGLEKSRNLMTVRLADYVGMETVMDYAERFGVMKNMSPYLSGALGAGETTLLRLTTGYAQFVNGGKRITPTFVDRIQDRRGKTIFAHDQRPCDSCGPLVEWEDQVVPEIPDTREQLADPRTSYQIVSMLEGVVQRGTGVRIKALKRPLAGKTGTTNESKDVWFIGFSPDLAVGVFIGHDEPKSLGKRETGSSVAVPIWRDFMKEALEGIPPMPFRVPPGIRQVRIDANDGTRAQAGDENVIWEAFLVGTEPTSEVYILDGKGISMMPNTEGSPEEAAAITGTGGLY
ncbi:MAG: penicillin-binding protein 1A [Alphaproteobacteria bacterium]|nr:penicillin-binding protein 1A [Alphaproteobacteria bacterium]